jgi:hypothetical protein
MACTPPTWLWAWDLEPEQHERAANNIIRGTFERVAGAYYRRYAYDPVYRPARILFEYALHPIRDVGEELETQAMISEWESIRDQWETTDTETSQASG